MYSLMSFVLYVFTSIFSSNIYCIIINIYNPTLPLFGRGRDCARRHWGVSGLRPGPTSMLIFIVGSCSHVYCYHLCDWSVKRDLPNSWSIGHFEFRR